MKDRDNNSRLVYSTELGRMCPSCGEKSDKCQCKKKKNNHGNGDGKVRVERSTKGRKGKGVSLISGIPLEGEQLKELAKKLKQICGTGGTIKDSIIEIQGDHRDILIEELNMLGYKAKKAGG
ncbi:MAG: translation initiation factor Sui1 [Thermodesulfobacteriota bacterium]